MYLQRNYHELAERYLKAFPVLCLIGARQTGKTEFAKHLRPKWRYLDLEKPTDLDMLTRNPELFFEQYDQDIIIDEAQEFPQLFKILRGVIDAKRKLKGRFIVTGSSSPELIAHLSDSLAGRIGIIRVHGLKANEYYQTPLSSFYDIFKEKMKKPDIQIPTPILSNEQVRHLWLLGGFPEALLLDNEEQYQDWLINYYASYINRDIARLFPRLDRHAYQRFISTLSSLSGKILNKADLARAIEVSERSINEYLQKAEQTFLWRSIPFDANSKVKSLVKRPKGYLTDSGLLHYLLKIGDFQDLLNHPSSGHSFESFVIEELVRGLQAKGITDAEIMYYRTSKGSEVDLIIKTQKAHIPIEIKMAKSVSIKQLAALEKYIQDNQLPFGLLINQSDHIFWVTDNILQVPISVL